MFDSSLAKGREPLEFQLGKGKVIKGNSLHWGLVDYFAILSGWFSFGFIKPLSQSCQSTALYSKKNKKYKIMSWWEHNLATIYKAWEHSIEHLTGNWFFFLKSDLLRIWSKCSCMANHIETWSETIKLNLVTVNTYT